uniref:Uncharacterized protein n=1 Tax=Oryza nivara TaxID=4536 RepID=A0A0E0FHB0_ORYNI
MWGPRDSDPLAQHSAAPFKAKLFARSHYSKTNRKSSKKKRKKGRRGNGGDGELQGDEDLGGGGEAGGGDAGGDAAAGVGGPVPDPPRVGGVDAHLPVGRRRGPGRHPRRARQGAGLLLPARRAHRGARGRVPRHPVHRRRRLLRRGRRRLQPGGRPLPGAPPPPPQGGPRPLPRRRPLGRRAPQHHHDDADHQIHLRRVRDGAPVQPRVGGRHGRRAVHQRGGRHGAGAPGAEGEAGVGQGEVPEPEHQARPPAGAAGAGARLHRPRLPHRLHRRPEGAVQGAQRQVLLRLRRADGEAVAMPHQGTQPRARRHREALLLRQRAPPAEAGQGVLRQLHLPGEDVGAERDGAVVVGDGGGGHDPAGEGEDGGGVLPVRQGGDGAGPVPDDVQLRVHLRLRLEQARVRRGGLRLRPAQVRRPARQQRLHRLRRHPQGAAAARRHADARQLRHQGTLGGVRPRHEGGPAMN